MRCVSTEEGAAPEYKILAISRVTIMFRTKPCEMMTFDDQTVALSVQQVRN